MKKTVFYKAITQAIAALVLSLVFSACSGVGLKAPSSSETNQSDIKYAVTGTIILNGAYPSINNASVQNASRTASTSLKLTSGTTLAVTDFNFSVTNVATEKPEEQALVIAKIDETTSKITYAAVFKESGKYKISCGLWNNTYFGESDVIEVKQTTTLAPAITLLPANCNPATQTTIRLGSVDLTIEDQSGKLSSVVYKGLGSDQEGTAAFANGSAHLQLSNVSPNNYEVTFNFNDLSGNTLYSHKEVVVVLPGFVTDTWFPAGSFAITDEMIDGYGTDVVPSTPMALYNYSYSPSDNKNYKIYFSDNAITSLPENADLGVRLSSGSNSDPKFCYDNSGELYMYSCFSENGTQSLIATTEHPDGYNFTNLIQTENVNSISYDRATDNLYIFTYSGDYGYLYSCEKSKLAYMDNSAKKYCILTSDITDSELKERLIYCKTFTVYNNILFIPYFKVIEAPDRKSASLILGKSDLSECEYNSDTGYYTVTITADNLTTYDLFSDLYTGSSAPKITDILYQDSNLYLLISDVYINNSWSTDSGFRSRGAVIRINFFMNRIDVLGWTNEPMDVSTAGVYMQKDYSYDSFYYADAEGKELFVFDGAKPLTIFPEAPLFSSKFPTLYVPDGGENLSGIAFYGPKKFIAIKPKKLVIADDGIAFYTDDDNALSYRNVNRVVIVDLESFAIEGSSEVPVKYAGGASSDYVGDYNRVLQSNLSLSCDSGNFYYGSTIFTGEIFDKNGERVNEFSSDNLIAIKCADVNN